MLYVVAWPLLSEADDTALRRLRAQYHPREAGLIGPHFTLVFGAPAEQETRLRAAFQAMVAHRPFWFVIDRIVRDERYLYAVPADASAPWCSRSRACPASWPSSASRPGRGPRR